MKVDTRDGDVRVPRVMDRERAEASEAAHRRLVHDQSRLNHRRFSDDHADVGRNVRKPLAYTTSGSSVSAAIGDVEVDVATPATAMISFPSPDCLLTGPIGFGHTM